MPKPGARRGGSTWSAFRRSLKLSTSSTWSVSFALYHLILIWWQLHQIGGCVWRKHLFNLLTYAITNIYLVCSLYIAVGAFYCNAMTRYVSSQQQHVDQLSQWLFRPRCRSHSFLSVPKCLLFPCISLTRRGSWPSRQNCTSLLYTCRNLMIATCSRSNILYLYRLVCAVEQMSAAEMCKKKMLLFTRPLQ